MKLLNYNKVLCFSPHPDDVEISMGGTILKNVDTHFTIIVFNTSTIENSVPIETRWKECKAFWKGVPNVTLAPVNLHLKSLTEDAWIHELEKVYDLSKYDAIFLPPELDTHYEHKLVNNIGMAMTRSIPVSVIQYRSASTLDTWIPNMFVNVAISATDKIKRLQSFPSQDPIFFSEQFMRAFHTHLNSTRKCLELTEQFKIVLLY